MEKKCKRKGCKRTYRAKGYCDLHYRKWRQGEYGKTRYKACSNEECLDRSFKKGLCEKHYAEWEKSTKGYRKRQQNAPAPEAATAADAAQA